MRKLFLFAILAACSSGGTTIPAPYFPAPPPPDTSPPPDPPPPDTSPPPDPPPAGDPLAGGILAVFRVQGTGPDGQPVDETFRVWITNAQTIEDVFQVQAGIDPNRFPAGALLTGPGEADHNLPWSWHLDPEDIAMAELAMEVCDGRPSFVEEFLDDYLKVGRFCPWGARLDSVEDHR